MSIYHIRKFNNNNDHIHNIIGIDHYDFAYKLMHDPSFCSIFNLINDSDCRYKCN